MIIYVDIDETICENEKDRDYSKARPIKENIEKINTLYDERTGSQTLDTYVGNEGIKAFISKCITKNDIPHLLLYGKAGTGKTTLAKLITKNIKCDVMYINASDERGIDTIRDKIVDFASVNSFNPIKVIILDEADYITSQAQAALRNVMETYSAKTRFILTANYAERIIEPLKSRCQSFHIEPPAKGEVAKHLAGILDQENVTYELSLLASLVKAYYPDIRKIINAISRVILNPFKNPATKPGFLLLSREMVFNLTISPIIRFNLFAPFTLFHNFIQNRQFIKFSIL